MVEYFYPLGVVKFEKVLPMIHNKSGVVSFFHFFLQELIFNKDNIEICDELFSKPNTLSQHSFLIDGFKCGFKAENTR